jgi:RNA polymerase sigma-70 factor, ECF subfamily
MAGAHATHLSQRHAICASTSVVKAMRAEGRDAEARAHYADLVARYQARASRVAVHYLGDGAEADQAVQDAFVAAYTHLASLPDDLPFEAWFVGILINGCLARIRARSTVRVRLFHAMRRLLSAPG